MEVRRMIRGGLLCLSLLLLSAPGFVTQSQQTNVPLSSDPAILTLIDRLNETPIFYNLTTERVHEIFRHGQTLGNLPNVLAKIGDSNTASVDFLRPFGSSADECDLGRYDDLRATIDYFSEVRFRGGQNSFTRSSIAALKSLSSTSALDPFWSPETFCQANETPVACEYRVTQASTAVIMLGLMDVRYNDTEFFYDNMEQIIQLSMEMGVIPVLTTISVLPGQALLNYDSSITLNGALLDLAEKYDVPLINLWRAVQPLPDYGIGDDRFHLKNERGKFCAFDGTERQLGGTLRNLLTLQALDELRREVLTQ